MGSERIGSQKPSSRLGALDTADALERSPSASTAYARAPSNITVLDSQAGALNESGGSQRSTPVQYRVEELRRTVYVTSEVPPAEWTVDTVDKMFQLAEIPEVEANPQRPRRTKSLAEGQILVFEDSSNRADNSSPMHNSRDSPPSNRQAILPTSESVRVESNSYIPRDDSDNLSQRSARQRRRESQQLLTTTSPPAYAQSHQTLSQNGLEDVSERDSNTSFTNTRQRRRESASLLSNLNTRTTTAPIVLSPPTPMRPRILFYHKHDPYYGFTNFSPHPVVYQGRKYPTSEHLFQSFKFHDHRPGLAEHIRTCGDWPSLAFSEARRFQPEVRPDWIHVNIEKMDIALELKFTQHRDLKTQLLSTRDAELVEDSDKDAFWGVGPDGRGRNELGKALERLREKLRGAGSV